MEPRIHHTTSSISAGEDEPVASSSLHVVKYWTSPFFERRGLSSGDALRYGAIFAEHAIEREDCSGVDHALLKEMGIVLIGHRIKILKALHDAATTTGTLLVRTDDLGGTSTAAAPSCRPSSALSSAATDSGGVKVAVAATPHTTLQPAPPPTAGEVETTTTKSTALAKRARPSTAANGSSSSKQDVKPPSSVRRPNKKPKSQRTELSAPSSSSSVDAPTAIIKRPVPELQHIIADSRLVQLITDASASAASNAPQHATTTTATAAASTSSSSTVSSSSSSSGSSSNLGPTINGVGTSSTEEPTVAMPEVSDFMAMQTPSPSTANDGGGGGTLVDKGKEKADEDEEELKWNGDSDNEEHSGSESEEDMEEDHYDDHHTSHDPSTRPPQPSAIGEEDAGVPAARPEDLPCINFSLIKDGQLEKLKELILASFTARQQPPRPHQWEAVYAIMQDLLQPVENLEASAMKNYLLQHATGSGKSLTIACLTYCLFLLRDVWNDKQFKYHKIVVMNDRKILDEQLGDTVLNFLSANGIRDVQRSKTSEHLAQLMRTERPRVIITTMQKFIKLAKGDIEEEEESGQKNIAIIADEAHRSHGRKSTRTMHEFLTGLSRQSSRLSYFSFTCTPNAKALEMFGVRTNGLYEPFHTYSIEHCIRDGYVLNPLLNYKSVGIYAKLSHQKTEEACFEEGLDATYHLVKSAADDRVLLREKAKYILAHFLEVLESKTVPLFQPKAMLIASSRKHVMWYKEEIDKLLLELPHEKRFGVVAAFTQFSYGGERLTKETDVAVNGAYAKGIVKYFKDPTSTVKLIIAADKFQTGFDEPMLHTLYIDKRLRGSNAVQTIGRANRAASGKTDTCIVDFVNSRRDIGQAFALYWKKTTLKCNDNRTPQEAKLDRVSTRLLQIPGIIARDLNQCRDHIMIEDALRIKAKNKDRLLEDDLRQYLALCDRLQVENTQIPYAFIRRLLQELTQLRHRRRIESFQSLLDNVTITIEKIEEEKGAIMLGTEGQVLQMPGDKTQKRVLRQEQTMTTDQIVVASNHEYQRRVNNMWDATKPHDDGSDIPEIDKTTLEFAQSIWASRKRASTSELMDPMEGDKKTIKERRLVVSRDAYGVLDREELTRRGLLPPVPRVATAERARSTSSSSSSSSSSSTTTSISSPAALVLAASCSTLPTSSSAGVIAPPSPHRLTSSESSLPASSTTSLSSSSSSSLSSAPMPSSSPLRVSGNGAAEDERALRRTRERRPPPLRHLIPLLSLNEDDKERRKALRALRDHVTSEESWAVVRELNGLQPLIELITNRGRSTLEDISSNLSERGWAIAALSELARDERNREAMRELQGIGALLRLLSPEALTPSYIQELALKALRNICLDNGTNQKLVRTEGGLPSVMELLLQTQNLHLQLEAAGTLAVLANDPETCVWLKGHATAIRQLLDLPGTPQPQFLASLFYILKRLCQADVNFRKHAMKDEALWHLTNRHAHALLDTVANEAQALRSFLDPSNFNHFRPSKRFVPNLQRSRSETSDQDRSTGVHASATTTTSPSIAQPTARRSRSSSVREPLSSLATPKRKFSEVAPVSPSSSPLPSPAPLPAREERGLDNSNSNNNDEEEEGGAGPSVKVLKRPRLPLRALKRTRSNSAPIVAQQLHIAPSSSVHGTTWTTSQQWEE